MKKTIAIILTVLFSLTILTGCKADDPGITPKRPYSMSEGYEEEYKDFSSVIHWVKNGDLEIFGRIFRPSDFDENKQYPVLIMSHGYNATGADATNSLVKNIVAHDMLCYTFDFCGGSVLSKSDGEFEDMTVLTEISDLTAIIDDFKNIDFVDSSKIALFGSSFGGLVTSVTAGRTHEDIAAVILQAPAITVSNDLVDPYEEFDNFDKKFIVLWGTADDSIERSVVTDLFDYFGEDRMTLYIIEDAPHSFQPRDYEKCMDDINAYLIEMGIMAE